MTPSLPLVRPGHSVHHGVLALTGYGLSVTVRRGRLVINDGIADERRRIVLARVGSGLKRVIVIGHSGIVSLDALRWLADVGAAFVHIDTDGRLIAVAGALAVRDARTCRGQASAPLTGADLTVARYLLGEKVRAQAAVSSRLPMAVALPSTLTQIATAIDQAPSVREVCLLESTAALAYWDAWASVATPFTAPDRKSVPAHWLTFGSRRSELSRKQSRAVNPANALLNYLYAIVEAEARLALLAVGCEPAMGVVHVDHMSRDSLALDVMEPVGPHVDSFVLDLLASRQFRQRDFFETRDGQCKVMPSLTHRLAETAATWARFVAPYAEHVAHCFAESPYPRVHAPLTWGAANGKRMGPLPRPLRTPLTQRNQRAAVVRVNRVAGAGAPSPTSLLPAHCAACGARLASRSRKYCDICWATVGTKDRAQGIRNATARRKAVGVSDARSSAEVAAKRWPLIAARQAEHLAWKAEHGQGPSRTVFLKTVMPTLRNVPIEVLVAATGLSRVMCYRVRKGASVPHWRHWKPIQAAVKRYRAAPDPEAQWKRLPTDLYAQRIAPAIANIPTKALRAAAGFSEAYVSLIKRGHYVPHRRHWPALLQLIDAADPVSARTV